MINEIRKIVIIIIFNVPHQYLYFNIQNIKKYKKHERRLKISGFVVILQWLK